MRIPKWVDDLYPHQVRAIQDAIEQFNTGSEVVLMDAPTGSGKTLIAELVRQQLEARVIYLCSSISLQTQFAKDFPYAAVLKGRSNYPTQGNPEKFPELTAADCVKEKTQLPACVLCKQSVTDDETGMHCKWCHPVSQCPYESAKLRAIQNDLVCTNIYYYLYEANYIGAIRANRQLVIVDEADLLEDVLLSFVEVRLTNRRAQQYGITPPVKKTVESSWVEWAEHAAEQLKRYAQMGNLSGDTIKAIRERKRFTQLRDNVKRLNDPETGIAAGGWVYSGYDKGDIAFKPIHVNKLANDFLWKHSPRWLLMSATMISFSEVAQTLGIDGVGAR